MNYPIKTESTDRVKMIFQMAYDSENMDAKFGNTLSKEENEVRRFILTHAPVLGHLTSIKEIKTTFPHLSPDHFDSILNKLNRSDVILLAADKTSIVAAYPFSNSETSHLVTIKEHRFRPIYAMCAIDALGIGFMFKSATSIESCCSHCGENVKIEIRENQIISLNPARTEVWEDMEYSSCVAKTVCKNTNFFSSEEHFTEWQSENPKRKGILLPIQEAFYLGKLYFEKRLET
ncbi:MAG: alkylmercury lyase family protein [Promethearchaeota archaeon]